MDVSPTQFREVPKLKPRDTLRSHEIYDVSSLEAQAIEHLMTCQVPASCVTHVYYTTV